MPTARRDVLKALAGAAAASCVRGPKGRAIGGSIVGGAHARGHRLREASRRAPARWEETAVAVVGGGIAGLSAAWAFTRAGLDAYVVLELEDVPGGTARSGTGPVSPYPWAAHYVPAPASTNRPLVALLDEVGAVAGRDAAGRPVWAEHVLCRDPQERVYYRGEWYEGLLPRVGLSREEGAQVEALEREMLRYARWRDAEGRRAFDLPRARSSSAPETTGLDRESMAAFLDRHGWTAPRLRWFVEYGCRDDFGTTLAQTSAWAGVHYFASRVAEGGDEHAEFLTWPEGNGRVVAHLAALAGPRLRTGALVADVVPKDGVVEVVWEDARGETHGVRAEHVVLALPRFLVPRVLAPWRERWPAERAGATYGAWMVANLTLRDRPRTRGFPLAWDNVVYGSPALGYVVATHQTGRDQGPTVFTYYLPLLDDDPRQSRTRLLETPWDRWVEAILADLGPSHPGLRDLVETVDVYLWGHAMVRPEPGTLFAPGLAAAAAPFGRVHFAHTDLSGFALFEEAQYWGVHAAEAVLRERKAAFRSWLT